MSIKSHLEKFRDFFVTKQVERMNFPTFASSNICRKEIIFEGRVQLVGFRFEVKLIAEKLSLTGNAENLEDGNVSVQLQGEIKKIDYLVQTMKNIKRIKISKCSTKDMAIIENEKGFVVN